MGIIFLKDPIEKQIAARKILQRLPDWFEDKPAREAYISGCAEKTVWVCLENL